MCNNADDHLCYRVYDDRVLSHGNCYMLNLFNTQLFGPLKSQLNLGIVQYFRQTDYMAVKAS